MNSQLSTFQVKIVNIWLMLDTGATVQEIGQVIAQVG